MDEPLIKLLEGLEKAKKLDGNITSTDVRQDMFSVIWRGFLQPVDNFEMPKSFYLDTEKAEVAVKAALQTYIDTAQPLAEELALDNFKQRLIAFQGRDVETKSGSTCDYFFGWVSPDEFDDDGNPAETPTSPVKKKAAVKKKLAKKKAVKKKS